jgi:hypothetical protein
MRPPSALRRQVLRRTHIVRQRTQLKNQVHAILARNLVPAARPPTCSGSKAGRGWRPRICQPMAPGPLRAFYQRVRARRDMQVAAARKLAVLCWHLIIKG